VFNAFLAQSFAGQTLTCRVTMQGCSGHPVPVRLNATYLPQSDQCLIVAMDLLEGEENAEGWKDSTMFRIVPMAIALFTTPDGVLQDVNPAWFQGAARSAGCSSSTTAYSIPKDAWSKRVNF